MLGEVLLIALLLAGTLALAHAHRSGWPLDLWLDLCGRDHPAPRSLSDPLVSEIPDAQQGRVDE